MPQWKPRAKSCFSRLIICVLLGTYAVKKCHWLPPKYGSNSACFLPSMLQVPEGFLLCPFYQICVRPYLCRLGAAWRPKVHLTSDSDIGHSGTNFQVCDWEVHKTLPPYLALRDGIIFHTSILVLSPTCEKSSEFCSKYTNYQMLPKFLSVPAPPILTCLQ